MMAQYCKNRKEEPMDTQDRLIFSELVSAHKRLWIKYQEIKHLYEDSRADPALAHERFFDEAENLFRPLAEAILDGRPLQDEIQKMLRETEHSDGFRPL